MKKKQNVIIIIAIAVVAALLLAYYGGLLDFVPSVQKELLNTYTEVDSGNYIDVSGITTAVITNMPKAQESGLSKLFTTPFGDVEHYFSFTLAANPTSQALGYVWYLTDDINIHTYQEMDAHNKGFGMYIYLYSATYPRLVFFDYSKRGPNNGSDINNDYSGCYAIDGWTPGVTYYVTLIRSGGVITWSIYTNPERTVQYGPTRTMGLVVPCDTTQFSVLGTVGSNGATTNPASITYTIKDYYLQTPVPYGPPTDVDFSYSTPVIQGGITSFDGSATLATGQTVTYNWDWNNDGTYESIGDPTTHVFTSAGSTTVVLKVVDTYGQYATHSETFTVQAAPSPPGITNLAATLITSSGATLHGQLTSMGGSSSVSVWFVYGTTTACTGGSTINEPQTMTAIGTFQKAITGLSGNTVYYFKAVGQNVQGTTYGEPPLDFATLVQIVVPTVTTNQVTGQGTTTATFLGYLNNLGGAESCAVSFKYGTASDTTVPYTYTSYTDPTTLYQTGAYSKYISTLSPSTTYYYRAYGNNGNEAYGNELSFTTTAGTSAPTVTTDSATPGTNSAVLFGTLIDTGGLSCTVSFEYRVSGAATWTSSSTLPMTTTGTYQITITGLTASTIYQYHAKATNPSVGLGPNLDFTTFAAESEIVEVKCWRCYNELSDYWYFNYTQGSTPNACGQGIAAGYPYVVAPTDCGTVPIPGFEIVVFIAALGVSMILANRRKKQGK